MNTVVATQLSPTIQELNLEKYVLELEVDGLTVVPPEVHGVPMERFDAMVNLLLTRAEEMVGCAFSLDKGPRSDVVFPADANTLAAMSGEHGEPSQFLIQRLASYHRVFRDLAINPIAVALIRHMVGERATRFSSHNSFVKWQGDFGYGKGLGLHADQTAMPLPWGRRALTANANWCLTDYTRQGGAFAWVPGSHKQGTRPVQPRASEQAVPVEAPKGSLLVFHGATWHGAYPRLIPGMRLSIANYYRHAMVTSQEDIKGSFDQALSEDCDDPALFRALAGFGDEFPYSEPNQPVPSALQ
ncbi:MAG: phytanoyl-CoA dioxygenase family protein [Pseudomonadales bacterium]